ncbi:MAG: gamma-glutamyl-gamma-aminobutyrate hydrolase family protein [Steroidobacteraceae bacterium]
MGKRPVIGLPADRRVLGPHPFHGVGEKYVTAVLHAADALPLLIPALGDALGLDDVLEVVDGLVFTGSPSNVEPHRYRGEPSEPGTLHDPARDATTLPLIARAVAAGIPVLGICRGFQEMNVAFGGTLWQQVHEQGGHAVHHEDTTAALDVQYAPAHEVELEEGGVLRALHGSARLSVNSLHHQGVRELARSARVEARALDGLIEAFSLPQARAFALAVQWHPEWKAMDNAFSRSLFEEFGRAARTRALARKQGDS